MVGRQQGRPARGARGVHASLRAELAQALEITQSQRQWPSAVLCVPCPWSAGQLAQDQLSLGICVSVPALRALRARSRLPEGPRSSSLNPMEPGLTLGHLDAESARFPSFHSHEFFGQSLCMAPHTSCLFWLLRDTQIPRLQTDHRTYLLHYLTD